jgi:hypothetical protein
MQRPKAIFILFLLPATLVACSRMPGLFALATPTPTTTAAVTPLPYQACGWAWASQDLPDTSSAFRSALTAAGLPFDPDETYAYAFGENCLRPDGELDHFATMETDFVVTSTPSDPGDLSALGDYAVAVLHLILNDFSPDTVPGPQRGIVEFNFSSEGGTVHQQVLLTDAEAALQNGLAGADLYQACFAKSPS